MEEACFMRVDTVRHGSQCLELKWSGTSLLQCQWTLLRMFPNVFGWNKVELTCCTRMDLVTRGDYVEQACYMPIHTFTCSSHWLKRKRSGRTLLSANGCRYTCFQKFGAKPKWNKLVSCKWTRLHMFCTVWSWNDKEEACCKRVDTVRRGSQCLELKRSGTSLFQCQ